jgi:ABC-type antimicrobial peptide transport system ATPase subunit
MEPTTEVAAFNTRLEADLVVAKLAEAGIDAFVIADNLGGTFPMMQMITGGYKVMVLEAVADEATEIVDADEDVAVSERSPQSAIFRFLARLSPTQILGVVILLAASIAATLYAVTQGTL